VVGGKLLPERTGYYLGARLVDSHVAAHGLAHTVRARAADIQRADEQVFGAFTA